MQERSTFVDIIGWVFVVLAGFGVLIGVMQNVMVHVMFPPDFHEQISQNAEHVGAGFGVFRYVEFIFAGMLALMLFAFVAAIRLLKRHNWARVAFMVLLLLGIAWNLAGLVLQFFFLDEASSANPSVDEEFAQRFESMMMVMKWAMSVMVIALSLLFGWIAWKLNTPSIRAEFQGGF